MYKLNLREKELIEIGKSLGADVCPCYYNIAVRAEGIGEIITKIDTNFKYYVLIIKPKISCSTKDMFNKLDEIENLRRREVSVPVEEALKTRNLTLLCENLYNVFEEAICEKELIKSLKQKLLQNGAIGALMTGSGSCVYGIFKNKEEAKQAYHQLKQKHEVYICTSYNRKK